MVSTERKPITGVSMGKDHWQRPWSGHWAKPPETERFFSISTTWGLGQFVLKDVFSAETKKFVRSLATVLDSPTAYALSRSG